ncbi:GGDEF domain-containing protein [Actinoplanes couchii]|uniref:GGDEF domain-containing protein n=1 Tax=Actinoplanes couchii TaxID=403638 RepID=A0ABQ3XMF1_9ACTN|nr:GGDEF domain-containing protein [Actinoplanes couchii]MDR6321599.1 diguanylate cyclase (GGDEF)-like protein [Actinoplanes couchii]GID59694.1 hypothetical protein Aco03nite_080980 [Actinoplanes couchii]
MSRPGPITLLLAIGLSAALITVHADAEVIGMPEQSELILLILDLTVLAAIAAVVTWRLRKPKVALPEPASDPLTGLFDRRGLHTGLSVALARNARGPKTVAVVLTELDGSDYGDELRRAYGRMLRSNVLGTDLVARLGGDLFAIVLQDIGDPAQPDAVVARIRAAMREPVPIGDLMVQPRAGFGIAVAEPGETDAVALLHRAGLALADNDQRWNAASTSLEESPRDR